MNIKHALVLSIAAGFSCTAAMAQNSLRIAQVYGGGGSGAATAAFRSDFVVIFNPTASARSLDGASLQYASASGTAAWGVLQLPNVTIPAGRYYLVQTHTATSDGTGGTILTGQDYIAGSNPSLTGSLTLSATAGRVALVSDRTAINTANPAGAANVLDVVGYGSTAIGFEGSPVIGTINNTVGLLRNTGGCSDTNVNSSDFTVGAPIILNSLTAANICPDSGFVDCNGNSVNDADEILATPSIDCNNNGVVDTCEISATTDRDGNGVIDSCQIAANPSLDCNGNGLLDLPEIATTPFLDSNSNGGIDTCETPGAGQDCNANNILDSWDLLVGTLTDVDGNGVADACEGASVVEVAVNGTVQPAPFGTRAGANGDAFFNVEGTINGTFASYGGLRFDISSVASTFNTTFGTNNWHVSRAYLFLQQSNAGFTSPFGNVRIYWSNQDAVNFTPGTPTTIFENFETDFADRETVLDYTFTKGTAITFGTQAGTGTVESHLLFDETGTNSIGGANTANEINSAAGDLTLALSPDQDIFVAATYAGRTNFTWRGPSLVVFAAPGGTGGPVCDPDVNQDGNADQGDVDYIINVIAGGDNPTGIDPDFNLDGNADQGDIDALVNVIAGGACP